MPKIKLIATDIDGTLIKDSAPDLYPEIIDIIKKLTDQGIIFFVASGRAYQSIRTMFYEVRDRIGYIAENGAHIVYRGQNLAVSKMKTEDTEEVMRVFRKYRDTCDYVISTPFGSLMETDNDNFIALIRDGYHNEFRIVDDILGENADIIKMALYRKNSIRELGESILIPKYEKHMQVCMAGEEWVDFMGKGVNKGNALRQIQHYLNISKENTMAFGDNGNDIPLMVEAGESYAVETAVDEVKKAAKYICGSYYKKGVYQVLKKYYETLSVMYL